MWVYKHSDLPEIHHSATGNSIKFVRGHNPTPDVTHMLVGALNLRADTGKTPTQLAADLAAAQEEAARLRVALEQARSYGSDSWATWLISEVDDALDTK